MKKRRFLVTLQVLSNYVINQKRREIKKIIHVFFHILNCIEITQPQISLSISIQYKYKCLVCWGGQPGFLLYTQANPGLLGWSARLLLYTPADPVSLGGHTGSLYTPANAGSLGGQPGFLLCTPAKTDLLGCQPSMSIF